MCPQNLRCAFVKQVVHLSLPCKRLHACDTCYLATLLYRAQLCTIRHDHRSLHTAAQPRSNPLLFSHTCDTAWDTVVSSYPQVASYAPLHSACTEACKCSYALNFCATYLSISLNIEIFHAQSSTHMMHTSAFLSSLASKCACIGITKSFHSLRWTNFPKILASSGRSSYEYVKERSFDVLDYLRTKYLS